MKRPVLTAGFLFAVAGLAGCPMYDHEDAGCYRDSDCARGYWCDQHNRDCVVANGVPTCAKPSDCDTTSTCAPAGVCEYGDCDLNHGCVAGYRCDSSSGVWECVPNGSISDEAGASSTAAGASAGGAAGEQSAGMSGAPDMSTGGVAGAQ
jgi:hypothetical protein